VLGCSTGAEAYSIAWKILSARPELPLILNAIDISEEAVQLAKSGVYSFGSPRFTGANVFEGIGEAEIPELFDRDEDVVRVKSHIKDVIRWSVGDATNPDIAYMLGPQDIVVANNFLCHMERFIAEKCLHNIARLVDNRGYIFVSGIDLDIKTKVAKQRGWKPIEELLEEVHHGDPRMVRDWPFNYSSLEPLNKKRRDWKTRYAQVFEVAY
jgi:chemotaxis methyl-accepting protein methylase